MKKFRNRKLGVLIGTLGFLGLTLGLLLYSLTGDLSTKDSSAATKHRYDLAFKSPTSAVGLKKNDTFKLKVHTTLPQANDNPITAELVIKFDKNKLKGIEIDEGNEFLGLNNKVNNTTGTITLDVAKIGGREGYSGAYELAEIEFQVLQVSATQVTIDPSSTFGVPNTLDYAASVTSLDITYTQPAPPVTEPDEEEEGENTGGDNNQGEEQDDDDSGTGKPTGNFGPDTGTDNNGNTSNNGGTTNNSGNSGSNGSPTTSGSGTTGTSGNTGSNTGTPTTTPPTTLPTTGNNNSGVNNPVTTGTGGQESTTQTKTVTKWDTLLDNAPVDVPQNSRKPLLFVVIGGITLAIILVVIQLFATFKEISNPTVQF